MLVVSRKSQEAVVIAGNVRVTVLDIDRGKVRLGIEAPREVPVMRMELLSAAALVALNETLAGGKPAA